MVAKVAAQPSRRKNTRIGASRRRTPPPVPSVDLLSLGVFTVDASLTLLDPRSTLDRQDLRLPERRTCNYPTFLVVLAVPSHQIPSDAERARTLLGS